MQIEKYRIGLEQFHETLNKEIYRYCSGQRKQLNLARTYSDFSDLFTLETNLEIQSAFDQTPECFSAQRKSLAKLRAFAMEQYLDAAACKITEEIARHEAERCFTLDGQDIYFIQVPFKIANESDLNRRRRLDDFRLEVLRESRSLREEQRRLQQAEAGKLGHETYLAAMRVVTGIDYEAFSDSLGRVLEATETPYLDRLRATLQMAFDRRPQDTRRCDLIYWIRSCEPAGVFPSARLLPTLKRMMSDLGVEPERQNAISVDLEDRPFKQVRACCVPIRVPDEIKVVLFPNNGYDSYAALLHEAGHACHFAWTGAHLYAEHRLCGDRGVTEAYAFLFESLVRDKRWLRDNLGIMREEQFLQAQALYQMYQVCSQIGRLRYEVSLHCEGGPANASACFAETMECCTGIPHEPDSCFESAEGGLEAADYLRAWIVGAMLEEYLRSRFGNCWFASKAAGSFFKEIWETGQLYPAEELCHELGLGDLDVQVLIDKLAKGLGR